MNAKRLLALSITAISVTGCVKSTAFDTDVDSLHKAKASLAEVANPKNSKGEVWTREGHAMLFPRSVAFYMAQDYEPVITPIMPVKNAAIHLHDSSTNLFDWTTMYAWVAGSCSDTFGAGVNSHLLRANDQKLIAEFSCDVEDKSKVVINFNQRYKTILIGQMKTGTVTFPELGAKFDTSNYYDAMRGAVSLSQIKRLLNK